MNKGYAGILALLIVGTIIIFLMVRPDVFGGKTKTIDEKTGDVVEVKQQGILETGIGAVEKAKQVTAPSQNDNTVNQLLEE